MAVTDTILLNIIANAQGAGSVAGLATAVTGLSQAALNLGKTAITAAGEYEQSEATFKRLLGSAEKAQSFLKELADFAANTPFELKGLQEQAQMLMNFGFTAKQVVPMLTAIGDSAGGSQEKIDRIVTAIGQMRAKGKISAEEMMQLAEAGVPAWDMLAKAIGTSIPEAMKRAEAGTLSAAEGIPALLSQMNERFGGMMEEQSKTLLGKWSNFKDNIHQTMVGVGTSIIEGFRLKELLDLVNTYLGQVRAYFQDFDLRQWAEQNRTALYAVAGALTVALLPAAASAAASFVALAAPIAPLLLAGAALGALLASLGINFDDIGQAAQQLGRWFGSLKGEATSNLQALQSQAAPILANLKSAVTDALAAAKEVWERVALPAWQAIAPAVQNVVAGIMPLLQSLGQFVEGAFRGIRTLIHSVLIPAWEAIAPAVTAVLGAVLGIVRNAMDTIGGVLRAAGKLFSGDWKGAWEEVKKTVHDAFVNLQGTLDKMGAALVEWGKPIFDKAKNLGTQIRDGIVNGVANLKYLLATRVVEAVNAILGHVPDWAKNLLGINGPVALPQAPGRASSSEAGSLGDLQSLVKSLGVAGFQMSQAFGANKNNKRLGYGAAGHLGVDYATPVGTGLYAPISGRVTMGFDKGGWGQYVKVIDEQGKQLILAHLSGVSKELAAEIRKNGWAKVQAGEFLGRTGNSGNSTGPHLHLEMRDRNNRVLNPGALPPARQAPQPTPPAPTPKPPAPSPAPAPVPTPKPTGKPEKPDFSGTGGALPKDTPQDIAKKLDAQIKAILAKVDIGILTKGAAAKLLQKIERDATTTARKLGPGWEGYAAVAKQAEGAIDSLTKKTKALSTDALGDLRREFEYVGKSGLPAYVAGLQALIAQQEKVAAGAKKGSVEQKAAMDIVINARKALADAQSGKGAAFVTDADLGKYRAQAAEVLRLEKALATSTDEAWNVRARNRIAEFQKLPQAAQNVLTLLRGQDQAEAELSKRAEARQKEQARLRAQVADTTRQLTVSAAQQAVDRIGALNKAELAAFKGTGEERVSLVRRQSQDEFLAREKLAAAVRDKAIRDAQIDTALGDKVRDERIRQARETYAQTLRVAREGRAEQVRAAQEAARREGEAEKKEAEARARAQARIRAQVADESRQLTVSAAQQQLAQLQGLNKAELADFKGSAAERLKIVKRQARDEERAKVAVARAERDKALRESAIRGGPNQGERDRQISARFTEAETSAAREREATIRQAREGIQREGEAVTGLVAKYRQLTEALGKKADAGTLTAGDMDEFARSLAALWTEAGKAGVKARPEIEKAHAAARAFADVAVDRNAEAIGKVAGQYAGVEDAASRAAAAQGKVQVGLEDVLTGLPDAESEWDAYVEVMADLEKQGLLAAGAMDALRQKVREAREEAEHLDFLESLGIDARQTLEWEGDGPGEGEGAVTAAEGAAAQRETLAGLLDTFTQLDQAALGNVDTMQFWADTVKGAAESGGVTEAQASALTSALDLLGEATGLLPEDFATFQASLRDAMSDGKLTGQELADLREQLRLFGEIAQQSASDFEEFKDVVDGAGPKAGQAQVSLADQQQANFDEYARLLLEEKNWTDAQVAAWESILQNAGDNALVSASQLEKLRTLLAQVRPALSALDTELQGDLGKVLEQTVGLDSSAEGYADTVKTKLLPELERIRDYATDPALKAQAEAAIAALNGEVDATRQLAELRGQMKLDQLDRDRADGKVSGGEYIDQRETLLTAQENERFRLESEGKAGAALELLKAQHEKRLTEIRRQGADDRRAIAKREADFEIAQARRRYDRSYGLDGHADLVAALEKRVNQTADLLNDPNLIAGTEEYNQRLQDLLDAQDALADAKALPNTLGTWSSAIEKLGADFASRKISAEEFTQKLGELKPRLLELADAAEKAGDPKSAQGFRDMAASLGAMTPQIAAVLQKMGKLQEYLGYFRDVAQSFGKLAGAIGEAEEEYDSVTGEKLQTPWKDVAANLDGAANAAEKLMGIVTDVMKIMANPADIGAWVGLITKVVSSIADAIAGFQKAKAEVARLKREFAEQNPLLNPEDFQKTYTRSRGFFADVFGGGPEVVNEIDKVRLPIAQTIAGGVMNGMNTGFQKYLESGNMADFSKALSDSVNGSVKEALIKAFMEAPERKNEYGNAIKALSDAIAANDPVRIAAAMETINAAMQKTTADAAELARLLDEMDKKNGTGRYSPEAIAARERDLSERRRSIEEQALELQYTQGLVKTEEYEQRKLQLALERIRLEMEAALAAAGLTEEQKALIRQQYDLQMQQEQANHDARTRERVKQQLKQLTDLRMNNAETALRIEQGTVMATLDAQTRIAMANARTDEERWAIQQAGLRRRYALEESFERRRLALALQRIQSELDAELASLEAQGAAAELLAATREKFALQRQEAEQNLANLIASHQADLAAAEAEHAAQQRQRAEQEAEQAREKTEQMRQSWRDSLKGGVSALLEGNGPLQALYDGVRNRVAQALQEGFVVKRIFAKLDPLFDQIDAAINQGLDPSGLISQLGAALPGLSVEMQTTLGPIMAQLNAAIPQLTTAVNSNTAALKETQFQQTTIIQYASPGQSGRLRQRLGVL